MQQEAGFTLIELIIVIVLLGVLSAVALPRFVDLSDDAHTANVQGSSAALAVGVNLMHSKYLISSSTTDYDGDGTDDLVFSTTTKWPKKVTGASYGNFTASAAACAQLWTTVLNSASATVGTSVGSVDYVAVASTTSPVGCKFQYRGNVGASASATHIIKYNQTTGAVTVSSP